MTACAADFRRFWPTARPGGAMVVELLGPAVLAPVGGPHLQDGRPIVIFSGGAKKDRDADVFAEIKAIRDGGGFGSIIGRNTFQRKRNDALKFLDEIIKIYAN